jgi:hypothetical protein
MLATTSVNGVLKLLNALLQPAQTQQTITDGFSKAAEQLRKLKLPLLVQEAEYGAEWHMLNDIVAAKQAAISKKAFKHAGLLQQQEQELLKRCSGKHASKLAPKAFFEYKNNGIIAHLCSTNTFHDLLKKLIAELDYQPATTSGSIQLKSMVYHDEYAHAMACL